VVEQDVGIAFRLIGVLWSNGILEVDVPPQVSRKVEERRLMPRK
jgi:hypothetical protein